MAAGPLHDTVVRLLHTQQQRLTPARELIVAVLDAADGPLTITEILAAGDGLAQSSVYRNLVVLEQAANILAGVDDVDDCEIHSELMLVSPEVRSLALDVLARERAVFQRRYRATRIVPLPSARPVRPSLSTLAEYVVCALAVTTVQAAAAIALTAAIALALTLLGGH